MNNKLKQNEAPKSDSIVEPKRENDKETALPSEKFNINVNEIFNNNVKENYETQESTDESSDRNQKKNTRKTTKSGKKKQTHWKQSRKHTRYVSSSPSSASTVKSFSESSETESDSSYTKHKNRKRKTRRNSLKRIPVSEWRIKYDGKDQGRRLSEFLKEIKMRSKAEDISERELFRGAIHLFSGRAKDWFMDGFENREFRTWAELKRELKREFLPPDLDYQIESQDTNRRQQPREKFVDYFHDMQKLFQSMTKSISERRRFEIIWRNTRFDYKNALTGVRIKTLSKLKKFGRIVDENNWNMFPKSSDIPNRPKYNQINELYSTKTKTSGGSLTVNTPNFAKKQSKVETNDQNRFKESEGGREGKNVTLSDPMEGSTKSTLKTLAEQYKRPPIGTCYNCKKTGHHYVECPENKRKFCRLCGFSDVLTHLCPVCQKNTQNSA